MQNFRALGAPPPHPRAPAGWGLCPHTPKTAPIANFWLRPFFALQLILGKILARFWVEQVLILIFVLLKFSELPGPPFSKFCVRHWQQLIKYSGSKVWNSIPIILKTSHLESF